LLFCILQLPENQEYYSLDQSHLSFYASNG